MDDMTITRLCAEAIGYVSDGKWPNLGVYISIGAATVHYDPLRDDAQCFALVKKFRLQIDPYDEEWNVGGGEGSGGAALHENLNRAICLCVARMQQAKGKTKMEWQPIETAPRGEIEFLGWDGKTIEKTWEGWTGVNDAPVYVCADWVSWEPTHWMPLPDAPTG